MNWLKKITRSSSDPEKLAMTAKGVLLALVPIVVALSANFGLDISQSEIIEFINSIFVVVSSGMIAFGLGRKLYFKIVKK